ncbi:MAG: carboxylesterase family protein [Prolixibacteraceae bacterium]|nr:carboxylesterase family protein [Prolixibacteraceae bacterium]
MKTICYLSLILLMISACKPETRELGPIVTTQNGIIEGYVVPEKGLHIFKGIPFAQPPVGELRWKAPQPPEKWEGVRNCKEFSAIAMQGEPAPFWMWTSEFIAPAGKMDEDCLYLNVWTPAKSTTDKLPVMVFIHGGGFNSGSGSVPVYNGENMAQKGVVFVTINYRVNIFGFFAHPELTAQSPHGASGNQGLLDQVAALQWVQQNIAAFGGDPEKVTIAGQSAGAFSVSFLKASPLCRGLFHRVIAESGGAVMPGTRIAGSLGLHEAEQLGLALQQQCGLTSLAELQAMDAKELQQHNFAPNPIVDGYFLKKSVHEVYQAGEQIDVPLISGWNKDEGLGAPARSAADFIQAARENYGELADEFLSAFPANTNEEAAKSQNDLNALATFGIQTYQWMLLQNRHGHSPVYVYHFTHDVPFGEGQQDFGAFHSGELAYAYDNLEQSNVRPWTDTDRKIAETMSGYWVNFAKNGDPNGEGLPVWNPCKSENDEVMNFNLEVKAKAFPNLNQLRFLKKISELN